MKDVLCHDDGCQEELDHRGFCVPCGFYPDMQSTQFKRVPSFPVAYKDALLRGAGGGVWLIVVNGEATGLTVPSDIVGEHSGYEQACDELVEEGLLTRGHHRAAAGPSFTFTKRGLIARWALEEATCLEADRKAGRIGTA